jgi:hypothetical protein
MSHSWDQKTFLASGTVKCLLPGTGRLFPFPAWGNVNFMVGGKNVPILTAGFSLLLGNAIFQWEAKTDVVFCYSV